LRSFLMILLVQGTTAATSKHHLLTFIQDIGSSRVNQSKKKIVDANALIKILYKSLLLKIVFIIIFLLL